jgi:3-oxoacyl-[acyl-carrier protein] reductase
VPARSTSDHTGREEADPVELGLSGRRAAVAAASAGLGRAVAEALAGEGADVAICGRDAERLEATAAASGLVPIVADVSDPDDAARFVREARERLGGVDIVVANAGGPPAGNFSSFPDTKAYADAFGLNCLSTIAMCLEAVPAMRAQRWGRVLAITSIAVRQPIPNLILSNTARAGVTAFLKTLATEVAGDGVTVNSIQPGFHETDRIRELHGGDASGLAASVPVRVLGRPADFGAVGAFLCSEQARFITGTSVLVDGGSYAGL